MLDVAALALHVARLELADYSRPKSPHLYTRPQLLAVLVLKAFLRQTYRGVIDVPDLSPPPREAIGLRRLPNFSTLKKFANRLTPTLIDSLVAATLREVRLAGGVPAVAELALDSTGVECSPASCHYAMRIGRRRGRYVKLSLAVACMRCCS